MNHQMSTSESVTKKARALVSTESTGVKMAGPLSSFTGWERGNFRQRIAKRCQKSLAKALRS